VRPVGITFIRGHAAGMVDAVNKNFSVVLICSLLMFLVLSTAALAYQVSLTATPSKTELKKGESFTYALSVIEEGEPGQPTSIVPPDFTGFNISSTSTRTTVQVIGGKERKVTETDFGLSSDIPGEHVIPPAKLVLVDPKTGTRQEMTSNEVKVTVSEQTQGLLGGIAGEIRDIKQPKTFLDTVKLYFYGLVALVVIGLLILAGFAIYVVGRKKKVAPRPAPSQGPGPRQAALAELDRAKGLIADTQAYYTAVTDAVRRYLDAVYAIGAMEATTAELMTRAQGSSIPAGITNELAVFFTKSDMVKFAKHSPDDAEKSAFLGDARRLVSSL
jgi:BatD DUF11 like domain